jgi:uncharacterized protein
MPDTATLQAAMAAALTARDVAAADVSDFAGDAARVRRRLGFYRGNVQANAAKALRNAYPVCAALVGDAFFDGLAQAYATREPSASGDLNEYGAGLGAFVAAFPPAAQLPYLADVAALEWHVHRAHYAADGAMLDVRDLAAADPERFGLLHAKLHPACALLASPWPVVRIWAMHQPDYAGEFAVDLEDGGERALVYRPRFRAEVMALDTAAFAFLEACARGATLDDATRQALDADGGFTLQSHLIDWVRERVIVAFADEA